MKRMWLAVVVMVLVQLPTPAYPAAERAVHDREVAVSEGSPIAEWESPAVTHYDPSNGSSAGRGEACLKDPGQGRYCDVTLLRVDVDPSLWETYGGGVVIDVTNDPDDDGIVPSEVHWYVWKSDAEGRALDRGPIAAPPGLYFNHSASGTVIPDASGYYRIEALYAITNGAEPVFAGRAQLRTRRLDPPGDGVSLPSVASGALPGPSALYEDPPAAPQLENRAPRFDAAPLLVSGTDAYVDGEYLYQDYIYDDWGAETGGSANTTTCMDGRKHDGDLTYPTEFDRYGGNAADLVEFRIDDSPSSVAYRITLNTLRQENSTIVAIAFDTDNEATTGGTELPGDPGAPFPGTEEVLRVWGTGAAHDLWTDGRWVTTPLDVDTDLEANQMTIEVSRKISDPSGKWHTTVAVGLHDPGPVPGNWLLPQDDDPVAPRDARTTVGGANGKSPSGIFNLGFRFDEPIDGCGVPPDSNQSLALSPEVNKPTRYAHEIDFDKLAARVNESNVPTTGYQTRIFPSRLELGEGRDLTKWPSQLGQLQPYSIYIPTRTPKGLAITMHGGGGPHWHFHGLQFIHLLGEANDNLVVMPHARTAVDGLGLDGWWRNEAEYEVFEVWNDVARHFSFPSDNTVITGGSAGGYGAYRLGTLYPDLFDKALTFIAPPGEGGWLPPVDPMFGRPPSEKFRPETLTNLWLENARNLPFMNVVIATDEIVPFAGTRAQNLGAPEFGIKGFNDLGYRFRFLVFDGGDHFGFNSGATPLLAPTILDIPRRVLDFLEEDDGIDGEPARVTFAYVPATDEPELAEDAAPLGLTHDHAYWVSGLGLADATASGTPTLADPNANDPAKGVIDAFSYAFGRRDPLTVGFGDEQDAAGSPPGYFRCTPGVTHECGALGYTEYSRAWGPAPEIPKQNRLDLKLTNLATATIDVLRAGLDPCAPMSLFVHSDSKADLTLEGPFKKASVTGATAEEGEDGLILSLESGGAEIGIVPDCAGH